MFQGPIFGMRTLIWSLQYKYENSACGSVDVFMSRANAVLREKKKAGED